MIKLFECYAGYGGASFALNKANIPHEIVGYSEIHKGQIKIYEQNHPNVKNYGDITKINIDDLPDMDLITGGFPCQDVSIAGLRDLSKGRTNTVFIMLDIIRAKKPKYCLLENVEGILSMHNGELLLEIIRQLKSMGYAVSYKLLHSKNHGTPQNRPRVWIACELNRAAFMFNPFPNEEELQLFVKDLLEPKVDESYYLTEKQITRVIERSKIRGKPLGVRLNPKIATTLNTKDPKHTPADSIFIDSNIVNTITSGAYSKQQPVERFYVKENLLLRCLTPKECFRLMGFFNDEINLEGIPKTTAYFSAGNGWDINLVSKIFKKWLSDFYENRNIYKSDNPIIVNL